MSSQKNNGVELFGKYQITAQERESRIETMQYAIASVELEGLPLSNEAKEVYQAYANGDLNFQERAEQIKLLASA